MKLKKLRLHFPHSYHEIVFLIGIIVCMSLLIYYFIFFKGVYSPVTFGDVGVTNIRLRSSDHSDPNKTPLVNNMIENNIAANYIDDWTLVGPTELQKQPTVQIPRLQFEVEFRIP